MQKVTCNYLFFTLRANVLKDYSILKDYSLFNVWIIHVAVLGRLINVTINGTQLN